MFGGRSASKRQSTASKIVATDSKKKGRKSTKEKMIEKDDFFAGDDDAEFEEKPKIMREANYMDDVDVINGKRKQEVYQEIEKTKEYAEMQYYNVKYYTDFVRLVPFNHFWYAFMEHLVSESTKPFLSNQFKYASKSYTEFTLALAVIDLPFRAGNHRYEANNRGLVITADTPLIAFYKEIIEDEKAEFDKEILVLQRYFEANDRY